MFIYFLSNRHVIALLEDILAAPEVCDERAALNITRRIRIHRRVSSIYDAEILHE